MDAIADQMRGAWGAMRDSMAALLEHVAALEARNADLTEQVEAHANTTAFFQAHRDADARTIADLRTGVQSLMGAATDAAAARVAADADAAAATARAARSPVVRKCSVCGECDGHNRATCPRVERKMTAYITA